MLAHFIPFGGHYYAATDRPLTWQQAENQAVKLGGHLAAVTSQAEQDFLTKNFAVHEDIWIGLSDHAKEEQFTWTTGERVAYTAFYPGEPNDLGGVEAFVQMNLGSGRWNDNTGVALHRGIIELNHPPTSTGKTNTEILELSFVKNANNKPVIEYDSRESIKDKKGNRYYFHVAVKIDALKPVKPNLGKTLEVRLYWATQSSGIIGGINAYAGRLTKPINNIDNHTGEIIDLYSYLLNTKQPPNATQLIAVIDPDPKHPLTIFKAKATVGIIRHDTIGNLGNPQDINAYKFIRAHISDATVLSNELKVPVEYILGLSAQESGYGTSAIALNAHNYFGLNANASGKTGTYTTIKNVKVAAFPASNGFLASGQSFVRDFGSLVHGQASKDRFVKNLVPKFNSGNSSNGGNTNFVPTVKDAIDGIYSRINNLYYYTT